jgi:hypothetical protein
MRSQSTLKQLIIAKLLGAAAVRAIVDGRVYGEHLEDSDNPTTLMPLVVVEVRSGSTPYAAPLQESPTELTCWSKSSQEECDTLYGACFDALQGEYLEIDGIDVRGFGREVDRPNSGRAGTNRAWWARGSWRFSVIG